MAAALLGLVGLAGCGESSTPSVPPPSVVEESAALSSCGQAADCPAVKCYTRICLNHACVPAATLGCCTKDVDCDDGNPCTADHCNPLKTCVTAATLDGGVSCCAGMNDCAPPNGCQQAAGCLGNSCTYHAVAGNPSCCDGNSDCQGGATCVANNCLCSAGQKYCGQSSSCIPTAACCRDTDCPLTGPGGNSCQVPVCTGGVCGFASSGAPGCCMAVSSCVPNSCQTATCTANQCSYAFKGAAAGCCTKPADCPTPTQPCTVNTCINNECGTISTIGCGVDLGPDLAQPVDLSTPRDLATVDGPTRDLSIPDSGSRDLARPVMPQTEDLSFPARDLRASDGALSLGGGGGCALARSAASSATGAAGGAAGWWIAAFGLALLLRRRSA